MFYPIINEKTVISEKSQGNNMQSCIIESNIEDLAKVILSVCKTNVWIDFGIQAEKTFKVITNERLNENIYM